MGWVTLITAVFVMPLTFPVTRGERHLPSRVCTVHGYGLAAILLMQWHEPGYLCERSRSTCSLHVSLIEQ